ncbi:MAG: hypothetical protein MUP92_00135 [Actinobacteria bacterium]|nr:hypothetical protein [Actinomycetota bacterium]
MLDRWEVRMAGGLAPKVLCVCTGNICRSVAMKLYLARAWKDDARVSSAGTYAMEGWEVPEVAVEVMASEDLDASAHEPTQLSVEAVKAADLVLIAATDHRAWIAQHLGSVPPNVFLLTEAAALTVFAMRPHPFERSERIRLAASALDSARNQLADVHQTNILDPNGLSYAVHVKAMNQCKAALDTLIAWIG